MATRTITGTILKPDQTAYTEAAVTFCLINDFVDGVDTYPVTAIPVTTDPTTGYFTVDLAVPSTGTAHYRVVLASGYALDVYLAAGASIDLAALLLIPGLSTDQDAIQNLIDGIFAGNVGIKTLVPAYALDVTGQVNASAGFRVGAADGATDTFTTVDGKTVTVTKGIITSIV